MSFSRALTWIRNRFAREQAENPDVAVGQVWIGRVTVDGERPPLEVMFEVRDVVTLTPRPFVLCATTVDLDSAFYASLDEFADFEYIGTNGS
jgi:hypothetical protein